MTDEAHVARLLIIPYRERETRFDEIWPVLSRQAIYSGDFDRRIAVEVTGHGTQQFDYAVQLFLSRIVFLQICEDREIENYETLKSLPPVNTFDVLMAEFRRANAFYNSRLFWLLDDEHLHIRISDTVLLAILAELYDPQSPYTFAVVETEVLGEICLHGCGHMLRLRRFSSVSIRVSAGSSPKLVFRNDRASHVGHEIFEVIDGQWQLAFSEKRRILLDCVRGVDIDSNAVEVARFSLLLKLMENETGEALRDTWRKITSPLCPR